MRFRLQIDNVLMVLIQYGVSDSFFGASQPNQSQRWFYLMGLCKSEWALKCL